jgi:hypothetical protein
MSSLDESVESVNMALYGDPKNIELLWIKANAQHLEGDYLSSGYTWKKILTLNPNWRRDCIEYGFNDAGDTGADYPCDFYYTQVYNLKKDDPEILDLLAICMNCNSPQKSLELHNKVILMDFNNLEYHANRLCQVPENDEPRLRQSFDDLLHFFELNPIDDKILQDKKNKIFKGLDFVDFKEQTYDIATFCSELDLEYYLKKRTTEHVDETFTRKQIDYEISQLKIPLNLKTESEKLEQIEQFLTFDSTGIDLLEQKIILLGNMEKIEEREKTCLFLINVLNEHISQTLEFTNIHEELMKHKQKISKMV